MLSDDVSDIVTRDNARPQHEMFSSSKYNFCLFLILALRGRTITSRRILDKHKWIFLKAVYVLSDQWG